MALVVKNLPANIGGISEVGLIPGSGKSSGGGNVNPLQYSWAPLMAQLVKNPPAMWETWI